MSPRHLVVASVIASILSASGTSAFAQMQPPAAAAPAPTRAQPDAESMLAITEATTRCLVRMDASGARAT